MRFLKFAALMATLLFCGCNEKKGVVKSEAESAAVQADVKKLVDAMFNGEVAVFIEYSHPTVIEEMGGKENAIEIVGDAIKELDEGGFKIVSFDFPSSPIFIKSAQREYVIVPTLMTATVKDQKIESYDYQLGVLEPGTDRWKYINGSELTADNVRDRFKDFPEGVEFPKALKKKL